MTATPTGLPPSVEAMRERMSHFQSDAGRAVAHAFVPRADDVFITTYPKCGTTLMQQIVHGLRTGGDMDFAEITEVVPWLDMAHDLGQDPNAEQRAWPRAFKSHAAWDEVPKGARYVYVVRDPRDVAVSFYHFASGWFLDGSKVDLDTFVREHLLAGSRSGKYWEHVASWWPKRGDADTLMLCFEDVIADLAVAVRRVARFIGVDEDPERISVAAHQASIGFMRAHGGQFDDHLIRDARNAALGLPADAGSTKVREGRAGSHGGQLSPEVLALLDERWHAVLEPATGAANYPALRNRIAKQ